MPRSRLSTLAHWSLRSLRFLSGWSRAGWAVHAGVGLFNQKGNNKFMYGNLTAGGFFGWMGREQLGAGRVMARALIPYPHYPHGSRGPLRLDREGECPGTVAFISCLDSEIDDLGVILL